MAVVLGHTEMIVPALLQGENCREMLQFVGEGCDGDGAMLQFVSERCGGDVMYSLLVKDVVVT